MLKSLIKKTLGFYINLLGYFSPGGATSLAYRFFTHPRDGRLAEGKIPEILRESRQDIITHKGEVFQTYNWPGNGPTVLLVHGWESNASRWELMIGYLKKAGANIVALDAPAHGRSSGVEFTMPHYAELIDVVAQKYKPEILIGHSLGGATSVYYQSQYQNPYIKKMVILGAPCDMDSLLSNYKGMLGLNRRTMTFLQKHFMDRHSVDTSAFSCSNFVRTIKSRGFLAHDIEDEVVSYKEARKIAAAWPDAEFVTTRGLGHSMHAKALYEKIFEFLFEAQFAHK